jgi:hypothetical protein
VDGGNGRENGRKMLKKIDRNEETEEDSLCADI